MEELLNGYFLQVLVFICINTILALTIYMTLCTGLLSLGNAGFMSFGAYTSAILTMQLNLPMPLGIFCGGVVAAIVGDRSSDHSSPRPLPGHCHLGLWRSGPCYCFEP